MHNGEEVTLPGIIGPLNLTKAPTLTQCGSGKQSLSNSNRSYLQPFFLLIQCLIPLFRLQVKLSSTHSAEARYVCRDMHEQLRGNFGSEIHL